MEMMETKDLYSRGTFGLEIDVFAEIDDDEMNLRGSSQGTGIRKCKKQQFFFKYLNKRNYQSIIFFKTKLATTTRRRCLVDENTEVPSSPGMDTQPNNFTTKNMKEEKYP